MSYLFEPGMGAALRLALSHVPVQLPNASYTGAGGGGTSFVAKDFTLRTDAHGARSEAGETQSGEKQAKTFTKRPRAHGKDL